MTAIKPFAQVVAARADVLEPARCFGVAVDRAGQRGLEAAQVRAAVVVVDVVGEGQDRLVVAVVVLQRDFDDRAALPGLPS